MQTLVDGPQAPHALLLVDVDHFKSLNDQHGHLVGDEVLCEIARRLSVAMTGETVARWGGEEFVGVLRVGCVRCRRARRSAACNRLGRPDLDDGETVARDRERRRDDVAGTGVLRRRAAPRRAELGLYDAKALGRNRCVARAASDPAGTVTADDLRRPA